MGRGLHQSASPGLAARRRYRQDGVIAIDNTLVDPAGTFIEDAGSFWDHADQRYLIAQDYLIANYVLPNGRHYPLEFRRFRKRDQCTEPHPFRNHTDLCVELIDWTLAQQVPGDFTFDSSCTHATILQHIHAQQRAYVSDRKANRNIVVNGHEQVASGWIAAQLRPKLRTKFTVADHTQW